MSAGESCAGMQDEINVQEKTMLDWEADQAVLNSFLLFFVSNLKVLDVLALNQQPSWSHSCNLLIVKWQQV